MFFLSAMYRSSAKPSISVSSLFIFDVMEEGGYFNFRVLVSRFFFGADMDMAGPGLSSIACFLIVQARLL